MIIPNFLLIFNSNVWSVVNDLMLNYGHTDYPHVDYYATDNDQLEISLEEEIETLPTQLITNPLFSIDD